MNKVARFDPMWVERIGHYDEWVGMRPAVSGEFIKFDDHAAALIVKDSAIASLSRSAIGHANDARIAELCSEELAGLLQEWQTWICGPSDLHSRTNAAIAGTQP